VKYRAGDNPWRRATYAEMGFVDKRKALPNKLWELFKTMAQYSSGQQIRMKTPANVSKDMDRIRATLRKFFGLGGTPIKYRKKDCSYDTKFHLTDGRERTTRS
jgi:hypothetical protein